MLRLAVLCLALATGIAVLAYAGLLEGVMGSIAVGVAIVLMIAFFLLYGVGITPRDVAGGDRWRPVS